MTKVASLACLSFALLPLGAALAQEPFVTTLPVRDYTARITIDFHDDQPTMVACTPEQVAALGARASERIEELLPALGARLVGRKAEAGETLEILLDGACYEGGIMGVAGYGRGEEEIRLAYEESADGETWGPARRAVQTEDNNPNTDDSPEDEDGADAGEGAAAGESDAGESDAGDDESGEGEDAAQ